MQNLLNTLRDSDSALVPILAQVWGAKLDNLEGDAALNTLHDAMLTPDNTEMVWDKLDDRERGALQMLIASQLKMPMAQFEIAFGKIRKMGKGKLEREMPHKNPQSVAEALFYRGLIAESFEQGSSGMRPIVYVPQDLAAVLPVHKTAYANLKDEMDDYPMEASDIPTHLVPIETEFLELMLPADTSIVDDLTTLLAYLRIHGAGVEDDAFLPVEIDRLLPHMLVPGEPRLTFALGVGAAADLITTQEGRAFAKRSSLQSWLGAPRWQQLKALVDQWRTTTLYQELWHVPGLYPEDGTAYDAAKTRNNALNLIAQLAPPDSWWSVEDFITLVKANEPEFMRGDFDSWYIRNDRGNYLKGFESWDAIEGAYLEYLLIGPLHWLGLVDLAEDAAHLTVWGRAFLKMVDWPQPSIPEESITYDEDENNFIASRKVTTVDRFQLARFTHWLPTGDPYEYVLDADSIQRAEQQGITTGHIAAFLTRHLGEQLPESVANLLEVWQGGGASMAVTFEPLLVLRTTTQEVMDKLYEEPAYRRYLGARLGPMAVVIRGDQSDALKKALGEAGITVEIMG